MHSAATAAVSSCGLLCTKQIYNFVQVSELAEKAADRSTRVAACEFLHAVTLWMIGMQNTSRQLTDLMLLPVLLCAWPSATNTLLSVMHCCPCSS
jgi:hypothetical protein